MGAAIYPETLLELQDELKKHAQDGRSDALFRHAIAIEQISGLTRHLTHDRALNPTSRPHGTRQGEINDAGHAIVQLMTYAILRDINIQEAINSALNNLRDRDFMIRLPKHADRISGLVTCLGSGVVIGEAWVCHGEMIWPPEGVTSRYPRILVAVHPSADVRLKLFAGIVTDHGGMACHAAIVSREANIPCISGCGNATQKIQTGDKIRLDTIDGTVTFLTEGEYAKTRI